ncbi:MAG: peptidase M29 [bacterium]|nr:peptidase M29 [bacterium]
MLQERIEAKWIDTFIHEFELCAVKAGDAVAILSETQSRPLNVHLAELALLRMEAKPFHIIVPTPPQFAPVPVRSSGYSFAIEGLPHVIGALAAVPFVADCTVEGCVHSPAALEVRKNGTRMLYISNDHPESLERTRSDVGMKARIATGRQLMQNARLMHITSAAGTDLHVSLEGAMIGGNLGFVDQPGGWASFPGGIQSCFPRAGAVNGRIVMNVGDMNFTFKRYLESPVTLVIENDFVVEIQGGWDAELLRSYFAAWGDPNAYAASHVSWGMNFGARWEAMMHYDKGDTNATEGRAVAGQFLYSTGPNPAAGRHSNCHFDLTLRGCTITLDGQIVVENGSLSEILR